MHKETFQIWNLLPAMFQKDFLKLPFQQQSCQRMTIPIPLKKNDWVFHTWTMILSICVVVDESKCLDTPIFDFSIICEHLPFSLEYKLILRLLLVHRNLAIWRWYPWSWPLSFEMLKILAQWILHKSQNCLLQYHRGEQLDLCTFGVLTPIQHFSDDKCPLMMKNCSARRPCFINHLYVTSDFYHVPRRFLNQFSHFLSTPAFAATIFKAWSIGINLWTEIVLM